MKYSHMYNIYVKVGNIHIYKHFFLLYQRDKGNMYCITYLKGKQNFPIA